MKNNNSGIYKITNTVNNKIYIGSALNFKQRFYVHKSSLKRNKHHSKYLQRSYNKYGIENFKFEVIAICPPEYLIKLEQWFLDNLKPEYNICKTAGSQLGVKHSLNTRLNRSIIASKYKHSKETIIKLSKANKFNKAVQQFTVNNEFIKEYKSIKSAALLNNRSSSSILDCVKGRTKTCNNYIWKYSENNTTNESKTKIKIKKKIILKFAQISKIKLDLTFFDLYKIIDSTQNLNDKLLLIKLDEYIDEHNIK